MPITTEVDNDRQLTIHTVIGDVSFDEVILALKQFWEDPHTINVLWDIRKGSVTNVFSKEAELIVNYVKNHLGKRPEGKTAMVVSGDLEFGISRMGQALVEINRISLHMEIFRSYEEAIQWLGEQ